jgi:hypothetical protein
MWLLGRLAPDHKTIADFRKDNGLALRKVCARFVELCREMGLLATSVAIDGSKFKAVDEIAIDAATVIQARHSDISSVVETGRVQIDIDSAAAEEASIQASITNKRPLIVDEFGIIFST